MQDNLKALITQHLLAISKPSLYSAITALMDVVYAAPIDLERPTQLQLKTQTCVENTLATSEAYAVEVSKDDMRVKLPELHCSDVEVSEEAAVSEYWYSGDDERGYEPVRAFYAVEMYKGNLLNGPFYEKLQINEEAYECEESVMEPSAVEQELEISQPRTLSEGSEVVETNDQDFEFAADSQTFEPAHPSNFLLSEKEQEKFEQDDANFVQMQDNLITSGSVGSNLEEELLEHVQNVTDNLLNNVYHITMNNRFMTPLLAQFVRRLCSGNELSDSEEYLSSSMQIPVYYSVHEEASGFLMYEDVQDRVVALADRYIIVEENYNDDGQFGLVMVCYDVIERQYVAIKKCKSPEYFAQLINEIRTLLYINCHDKVNGYRHFCHMKDFFIEFSTLFIVFEFLGENLYQYSLKVLETRKTIFSMQQLKQITKAILDSVVFLENLGILHFDLKPENIVLWSKMQLLPSASSISSTVPEDLDAFRNLGSISNVRSRIESIQQFPEASYQLEDELQVKLIDIGSHEFFEQNIIPYVQSRFYRAPEVFLKVPYDGRTESFSLGCVLYELLTGKPMFVTNVDHECYAHQLASFVGLLGPIPEWMILAGSDSYKYFTEQYEIYCDKQELADAYFEEFGTESKDEILSIPGKYCILRPLRCGIRQLLEQKLEEIYDVTELDTDMANFVDFVEQCLMLDMRSRPYPHQLAELPWAQ